MTQLITENLSNVFKYKEKVFMFLVVGIVVSVFSYIYFLHSAIANVVQRENTVKEYRLLSTNVNELEGKYFEIRNSVNIELAHEKGFKDNSSVSFIYGKSLTAMADHNEL